jgi:RNA polymerase sigma-70 factor, ECF subfamily
MRSQQFIAWTCNELPKIANADDPRPLAAARLRLVHPNTTRLDSPTTERAFRDELAASIPMLRSFARGLCGRRDLADDLAQEALLRAWAARASYTPGTNFRAWTFKILRNLFYSSLRKDKRLAEWDPDLAARLLVDPPGQEHAIHLADVAAALQQLPAEQREVLVLVGVNGTSYEEAARITGCAIGTIKSRVARGRKALAKLIDGPERKT